MKIRIRSRVEEARIRKHYRQFTRPGSLAFDVGANHGHHARILAAAGCRVVAVEMDPDVASLIGGDNIEVVSAAAGAAVGEAVMYRNEADVLSTLSERFAGEVERTIGYKTVGEITVQVTTLDELRDRFGTPDYVKIDVEGYEAEVLKGMTFAPAAVGFEFHGSMLDTLEECLGRLDSLNGYEYRVTTGNGFTPKMGWGNGNAVMELARELADGNPALYADVSCRRRHE